MKKHKCIYKSDCECDEQSMFIYKYAYITQTNHNHKSHMMMPDGINSIYIGTVVIYEANISIHARHKFTESSKSPVLAYFFPISPGYQYTLLYFNLYSYINIKIKHI